MRTTVQGRARFWSEGDATDAEERKKVEATGHVVGDAIEDMLGFTEAEKKEVILRSDLAMAVRKIRQARGMTQAQLGRAIGSTQQTLRRQIIVNSARGSTTCGGRPASTDSTAFAMRGA